MGSILSDAKIKSAIHALARRAERIDSYGAVESFYDCNIISKLNNTNHQIIQGRRGTGKTHILFVLKETLESENRHCIYFDCKTAGSAADISDSSLPENHRAIQLMRDFLRVVYSDFSNYFSPELSEPEEIDPELEELLNTLAEQSNQSGKIIQNYERTKSTIDKKSDALNKTSKFSFASVLSLGLERAENKQQGKELETRYKTSGISYEKVVFPNVFHCIERLAEITKKNFVVLINEWSNLPLDIQPHFGEFIRRCFISNKHVTIKIAVVKGRNQYCIRNKDIVYGLEIGPDINVDMDLDNIYMCDKNPPKVFSNLHNILWTHLKAKGVMGSISSDAFLQMLFQDLKSAILLVRASEGNPRDFISLLNHCITELDGLGVSDAWIDSETIFIAADEWYHNEKESALNHKLKELFAEISNYVVIRNETRGCIMKVSYLEHLGIKSLIDARLLHVVQIGRHFPISGEDEMAIVILDFGTYSSQLRLGKRISFLTNDFFEKEIVPNSPRDIYGEKLYDFDRNRKFHVCIFDPDLSPDICPSFSEFGY